MAAIGDGLFWLGSFFIFPLGIVPRSGDEVVAFAGHTCPGVVGAVRLMVGDMSGRLGQ